jgi:hypothetical protein
LIRAMKVRAADLVGHAVAVGLALARVHLQDGESERLEELRIELRQPGRGEKDDDLVPGAGGQLTDQGEQLSWLGGGGADGGALFDLRVGLRLLVPDRVDQLGGMLRGGESTSWEGCRGGARGVS